MLSSPQSREGMRNMVWESPSTSKVGFAHPLCHDDRPRQRLTAQTPGLLSRTHCVQVGHRCLQRRGERVSAFLSQCLGQTTRRTFHGVRLPGTIDNYFCHCTAP